MPRQARLDSPGTLHHVMIRADEGMGSGMIFVILDGRDNFFEQESTRGKFSERLISSKSLVGVAYSSAQ